MTTTGDERLQTRENTDTKKDKLDELMHDLRNELCKISLIISAIEWLLEDLRKS